MAQLFFQEKGYQLTRSVMGTLNRWLWHDYEHVVHAGQAMMTWLKIPSLYTNYSRYLHKLNIKRSVFSLQFESPITFAAFESHLDSLMLWRHLGCGGGCLKTIKFDKELGNPRPRMQQLKINGQEHLINALGLPGPGGKALINAIEHHPISSWHCPLGVSVGGHSLSEYQTALQQVLPFLEHHIQQPYIELNISCPNTSTGQSMHDNLDDLNALIQWFRSKSAIVTVIKVSPDASDQNLCDIAALATTFKDVTINAGNTQYKTTRDVGLSSKKMSIGGGGLSGPELFPRTLDMAQLLQQFKLPLIATGGISSADQVLSLFEYGVQVVGFATQLVKNPFSVVRMNHELHDALNKKSHS